MVPTSLASLVLASGRQAPDRQRAVTSGGSAHGGGGGGGTSAAGPQWRSVRRPRTIRRPGGLVSTRTWLPRRLRGLLRRKRRACGQPVTAVRVGAIKRASPSTATGLTLPRVAGARLERGDPPPRLCGAVVAPRGCVHTDRGSGGARRRDLWSDRFRAGPDEEADRASFRPRARACSDAAGLPYTLQSRKPRPASAESSIAATRFSVGSATQTTHGAGRLRPDRHHSARLACAALARGRCACRPDRT